ncbi:M15 family metallopeptidase [bacterium]|nr:M15 family metallopeptidase [bacterium]
MNWKKAVYTLKIFGITVGILLILATLEWQFSPLQKTFAWYQLRTDGYTSLAESQRYVSQLFGEPPYHPSTKFGLILEDTITETSETAQPHTSSTQEDANFLTDQTYLFPVGQDGIYDLEYHSLYLQDKEVAKYTHAGKQHVLMIPQVTYTGKKDKTEVEKELTTQWKTLVSAITKKDKTSAETLLTPKEFENFSKITGLKDLSYRVAPTGKVKLKVGAEESATIQVGTVEIKQSNCSVVADVPILYLKDQKIYRFSDVYVALASLCEKPKPTSSVLSCANCWLAPVSKQFALKSTYAPYTVSTGLNGGGTVTPETKGALTKLFADAKAAGITKIRVSSSYRSFTVQTNLFNTYVRNEKKSGLSEAQAIEKANTYSAKPGHSEHQLGTTLDLVACSYPCSLYDSANGTLNTFLHNNAYKYGFVISYPNGSQAYTGYVYEPWHIRYVGVNYATELYNRGYLKKKGFYLYQFLLEKGKY